MPTYLYKCTKCEQKQEAFRKISERDQAPSCCDQPMKKLISTPQIGFILGGGDNPGYVCPVTEQYVTSKKQRKEIMAKHDLVDAEPRKK